MARPKIHLIAGDWVHLERTINNLFYNIINETRSLSDYILADGTRPYTGTYIYKKGDENTVGSIREVLESKSRKIQIRDETGWKTIVKWSV